MTWGMIEDTPYRLDGGATTPRGNHTPGPVFHIPEVPKRDRIALELVEKASKAHRAKKQEALKRVTASFARSVLILSRHFFDSNNNRRFLITYKSHNLSS